MNSQTVDQLNKHSLNLYVYSLAVKRKITYIIRPYNTYFLDPLRLFSCHAHCYCYGRCLQLHPLQPMKPPPCPSSLLQAVVVHCLTFWLVEEVVVEGWSIPFFYIKKIIFIFLGHSVKQGSNIN